MRQFDPPTRSRRRHLLPPLLAALLVIGAAGWAEVESMVLPRPPAAEGVTTAPSSAPVSRTPDAPAAATSALPSGDPVLVGAGDIATCRTPGSSATAALIRTIPGTVFTAGDNAYERGTAGQFALCYGPTWGPFLDRTRPAVGNHEYASLGARPYFAYFGRRAGAAGKGWYAYNLGGWRIYVLNSNCAAVGGCALGSPQERWLRRDLGSHPHQCVLAYWHHPLFSSGSHRGTTTVRQFWRDLYAAHAEVVINGHDHDYERFGRMTPLGVRTSRGIREFVVGTGGHGHRRFVRIRRNSLIRDATTFGVLKLTLHTASYAWEFIPTAGGTFTDSGTGTCG